MSMSDPIADMLTRIRNALMVNHQDVEMPFSKLKKNVAEVLKKEGYINDYHILDGGVQGVLKVDLKYGPNNEKVITGLSRTSKPGLRKYAKASQIPTALSGLGIAILSSSQGVISDREARQKKIGGEVLCQVW